MLDLAKPRVPEADIVIGDLLTACDVSPSAPLLFTYGGKDIRPGYHVTEVKAGNFSALDCGGNPESWSEIFIQLWDIVEDDRTHMTAGKFASIIRKVSEHLLLDGGVRLTFEVSDGIEPMQLHHATALRQDNGTLRVSLAPRAASCKPRDRWLEERRKAACC